MQTRACRSPLASSALAALIFFFSHLVSVDAKGLRQQRLGVDRRAVTRTGGAGTPAAHSTATNLAAALDHIVAEPAQPTSAQKDRRRLVEDYELFNAVMDNPVQLNFESCEVEGGNGLFTGTCSKTSPRKYTIKLTLDSTNRKFSCMVSFYFWSTQLNVMTWEDKNLPLDPAEAKKAIVQLLSKVTDFGPIL
jgi:hypothetical protein